MFYLNDNPNLGQIPSTDEIFRFLLAAIAAEELSLADLISAEADKVRAVLGSLPGQPIKNPDIEELERIDRAAERILRGIIKKEIILEFQLEDILDFLISSSSTTSSSTATTTASTTSTTQTSTTTTGRPCAGSCGVVGSTNVNEALRRISIGVSVCGSCGTIEDSSMNYSDDNFVIRADSISIVLIPNESLMIICGIGSITISGNAVISDPSGSGVGTFTLTITNGLVDTFLITAFRPANGPFPARAYNSGLVTAPSNELRILLCESNG